MAPEVKLIPSDNITPEGYGHYDVVGSEFAEIPEPSIQNEELSQANEIKIVHQTARALRNRIPKKLLAGAVAVATLVGGAIYLKDNMPQLPSVLPDASHDLGVEINNVQTTVVHDKRIEFLRTESTFVYNQHTSLDRPGPFNCDTDINKTISTIGTGSITLKEAIIKVDNSNKTANIIIDGDIEAESTIDIGKNNIVPKMGTGGVDVCTINNAGIYDKNGKERPDSQLDEMDWAIKIATNNIENAGKIAYNCATQQAGEQALKDAIKYNAQILSDKLDKIKSGNITVEYKGNFKQQADNQLNKAVANFYKNYENMASSYIKSTDNNQSTGKHTNPSINARLLTNCANHKIVIKN